MAVYKIVRTTRSASSTLDSGYGEAGWARAGRDKHLAEELAGRLERIRSGSLEHEMKINVLQKPDTITLLEDCRCQRECTEVESITAFAVQTV